MRTQEFEFDGRTYTCRVVESIDGEDLLIGSTNLLDALHPGSYDDANERFASEEAERLYDEIFFFIDRQSLLLPDVYLITKLSESNPDRFKNNQI